MAQRSFTDMCGRAIAINYPPERIVSLVPSQTELLFELGLDKEVAGITKFCVHPAEWFRTKTRVGGTKQLHLDKIRELQPDLIIANKEENTKEQIEALAKDFPVWVSNIQNIDQALQMISEVGILVNREEKANRIVKVISAGFATLQKSSAPKRVAYFIWRDPCMCAGGNTFISDMIKTIGWVNVFADTDRYPEVSADTLKERDPEIVLLSSEPYPFREKHIPELQALLPHAKILLVDGEIFSWYGSRMLKAIPYLSSIL